MFGSFDIARTPETRSSVNRKVPKCLGTTVVDMFFQNGKYFFLKSCMGIINCFLKRELLSGGSGAFQNGSARTRSDADAAHMRKASGIMQMRQTRQMQIDEDACIRN